MSVRPCFAFLFLAVLFTNDTTLAQVANPELEACRATGLIALTAVNLRDRSAAWQKAGWKSFDPASKPYGVEEIKKESGSYTAVPFAKRTSRL